MPRACFSVALGALEARFKVAVPAPAPAAAPAAVQNEEVEASATADPMPVDGPEETTQQTAAIAAIVEATEMDQAPIESAEAAASPEAIAAPEGAVAAEPPSHEAVTTSANDGVGNATAAGLKAQDGPVSTRLHVPFLSPDIPDRPTLSIPDDIVFDAPAPKVVASTTRKPRTSVEIVLEQLQQRAREHRRKEKDAIEALRRADEEAILQRRLRVEAESAEAEGDGEADEDFAHAGAADMDGEGDADPEAAEDEDDEDDEDDDDNDDDEDDEENSEKDGDDDDDDGEEDEKGEIDEDIMEASDGDDAEDDDGAVRRNHRRSIVSRLQYVGPPGEGSRGGRFRVLWSLTAVWAAEYSPVREFRPRFVDPDADDDDEDGGDQHRKSTTGNDTDDDELVPTQVREDSQLQATQLKELSQVDDPAHIQRALVRPPCAARAVSTPRRASRAACALLTAPLGGGGGKRRVHVGFGRSGRRCGPTCTCPMQTTRLWYFDHRLRCPQPP